jgi:hypothetical protein
MTDKKELTAAELRIGNLIEWQDDSHEQFRVETIDFKEPNYFVNGGLLDDMLPIPLTEEWLIKFGFYKDGDYYSKGINDYKYCFRYRDWAKNWAFYQEFTDSPDPKDDGVKYPVSFDYAYIHQLQNLFFALTGEELELINATRT